MTNVYGITYIVSKNDRPHTVVETINVVGYRKWLIRLDVIVTIDKGQYMHIELKNFQKWGFNLAKFTAKIYKQEVDLVYNGIANKRWGWG